MLRMFDTREDTKIVISDDVEQMISSIYLFAGVPDNKEMEDRIRDTVDNSLQHGPLVAMIVSEGHLITLHNGECASQIYKDAVVFDHEIFLS